MTRYLDVSTEIARQVRSGELGPGTELLSVREHARRHDTTASTVNRAYRCLAEHKVIVLSGIVDLTEAGVAGERNGLGATTSVKLGQDVTDPVANRLFRQEQPLRDSAVVHTVGQQR